jgi:acetyl esterase/lipase
MVSRLFKAPFRGNKGATTFFKDIMFASMRAFMERSDLSVNAATFIPTETVYDNFCKANKLEPQVTELADNAKGLWIGSPSAEKVIVYFHGGGYVMAAIDAHFSWCLDAVKANPSTAVVLLSYTVALQESYPTQLRQAVTLLRHLLETEKRDPTNLVLAGDSAGGNLALGVLSHIAHPHPAIPALSISAPFRAALLVSPWASFELDKTTPTSSVVVNKTSDCFGPNILDTWSSAFMGNAEPDPYNQPLRASGDWWYAVAKGGSAGVPEGGAVRDVMIWGGGGEILVDSIKELAIKLTAAFEAAGRKGAVQTVITPGAAHDEVLLDKMFGYKEPGACQQTMDSFVKAKL